MMDNSHQQWQQGKFIDQRKYSHMPEEWKQSQKEKESLLVRPYPMENAICMCTKPEEAKWIAERLNLASVLEQMTYDFATGKTDGQEIVNLVHKHIDS